MNGGSNGATVAEIIAIVIAIVVPLLSWAVSWGAQKRSTEDLGKRLDRTTEDLGERLDRTVEETGKRLDRTDGEIKEKLAEVKNSIGRFGERLGLLGEKVAGIAAVQDHEARVRTAQLADEITGSHRIPQPGPKGRG